MIDKFNIRVYGIALKQKKVLLCQERISGLDMLKFPGGGLEFGEGLTDGLEREIFEESGIQSTVKSHFYTTDFFVQSAFKSNEQLISVYFIVDLHDDVSGVKMQLSPSHDIQFFWEDLTPQLEKRMTFPIDRLVIRKLVQASQ